METNNIVQAFEKELNLTEKGLLELGEQKKGLVIDVSTDTGFKEARKERTELNKVLKSVDRLAIDGKADIDEARKTLKDRVSSIYAPIVQQFEKEDERRKEEARKKEEAEKERVAVIHEKINGLRVFASNILGKSSEELQEIIEAVDMIDVSESFAEFTQEAMTVKKEVLIELNGALSSAIQNEQLAVEREQLRKEREQQEEQNRLNALKAKAQERLNNLMMIPTTMFGKTSKEIEKKINSISTFAIEESGFGELTEQALIAAGNVCGQLKMMLDQQVLVEKAQANELAKSEAEQSKKYQEDMTKAQVDTSNAIEPLIEVMEREIEPQEEIKTEQAVDVQQEENPEEQAPERTYTKHDEMIRRVQFWAKEYGVVNSEYSDLMNILNQYK